MPNPGSTLLDALNNLDVNTPAKGSATAANSTPVVLPTDVLTPATLGSTLNKTRVMKTNAIATTTTTAEQVVLSHTVTTGKTFYLEAVSVEAYLSSASTVARRLGNVFLEEFSSSPIMMWGMWNNTVSIVDRATHTFSEPVPFTSGNTLFAVCSPTSGTSTTWRVNFIGYEA